MAPIQDRPLRAEWHCWTSRDLQGWGTSKPRRLPPSRQITTKNEATNDEKTTKTMKTVVSMGQDCPPTFLIQRNFNYERRRIFFIWFNSLPPRLPEIQGWTVGCSGNFFKIDFFQFFKLYFLEQHPHHRKLQLAVQHSNLQGCIALVGCTDRRAT